MYLLAIESSTKTLSVALFHQHQLIQEIIEEPDGKKTHSEKLLPLIDSLLQTPQVILEQINHVAVAIGPGAYTSLRVGLATVMGLAQTNNIPAIPVSTLKAMAWGAKKEGELVVPLLKAGRGYVYAGGYRWIKGELKEEILEAICDPEKLSSFSSSSFFIGPGSDLLPKSYSFKTDPTFVPRACFVGEVAIAQKISSISPTTLRARYFDFLTI